MNFVIVGTDHKMQYREPGFEGLLRSLCSQQFLEPLTAIFEEYHEDIGSPTVAERIAQDRHLPWSNLDMTVQEKQNTGILEEQRNRPKSSQGLIAYRLPSDDIREDAWVEKLIKTGSGTILVVCGYLHLEPLVKKIRARGYAVDKRVYMETVPAIMLARWPTLSRLLRRVRNSRTFKKSK